MSSCAGYHTPIEDEVAGEGASDLPSDLMPTSRGGSLVNAQVVSLPLFVSVLFRSLSSLCSEYRNRLVLLGSVSKFGHNDRFSVVRRLLGADSIVV